MIKWPGLGTCETAWAGCKKSLVSTRNYLPDLQRGTSSVFGLFHKLLMIPPVIWMPVEMFSRTVASGLLACPLWSSLYGLPWWIVADGLLVHMGVPCWECLHPFPYLLTWLASFALQIKAQNLASSRKPSLTTTPLQPPVLFHRSWLCICEIIGWTSVFCIALEASWG